MTPEKNLNYNIQNLTPYKTHSSDLVLIYRTSINFNSYYYAVKQLDIYVIVLLFSYENKFMG